MNMQQVVPFYFQENEIRTVKIDNNPWFLAKDVCDALGLGHITNALQRIPEDHLTVIRLQSGGQSREMKAISEPGLYRLVLRSDKPQAEPFIDWVTAEVLPAIRKTGSYTLPRLPLTAPLFNEQEAAVAIAKTREGELMIRELQIGVKVARTIGIKGRRRILEEARGQVIARCGVDPLQYFHVDLDKLYPRIENRGPAPLVGHFIADEVETAATHLDRVLLKEVYARFRSWYAERVDERLRGFPTIKHLAAQLREKGMKIERRGGRFWMTGVQLIGMEV